jgi:hypothetical protein
MRRIYRREGIFRKYPTEIAYLMWLTVPGTAIRASNDERPIRPEEFSARIHDVNQPMDAELTFNPDGKVYGLYTEVIDLTQLGGLHVERASRVEFDNGRQTWVVWNMNGIEQFKSPSRTECLKWESRELVKAE